MDYFENIEICNTTIVFGILFILSFMVNCYNLSQTRINEPLQEIEMTESVTEQQMLPTENVKTQTSPIADEDKMYTDSMRNYMKSRGRSPPDIKIEIS